MSRQRRQGNRYRSGHRRWPARLLALLVAVVTGPAVAATPAVAGVAPAHGDSHGGLRIELLSGRADLVTGGDAVVAVTGLPPGAAGRARVRLNGRDVTGRFAVRADGRFTGLVSGLHTGRNELVATAGHGPGARIVLTDHPVGGPLFAGPQVQPWDCTLRSEVTGLGAPTDAQCDTAPVFRFVYMPAGHTGFRPYDPAHPPADVASTTTDQGVTVPYIVRLETGVADRGIYWLAVLADPTVAWAPWAARPAPAQRGWNHKVLWLYGGGSAPHHTTDLPVDVQDDTTLSRGFLVASSGLNVHGSDANENVSAEAMTIVKEHVVEAYGQIRYTMGFGCSGGSIQQVWIAQAYPGLLDGILPNCTYPDLWTVSTEVTDCGLLVRYFATATGWTDAQKAAVAGTKDPSVCAFWNASFVPVGIPSRAQNCGFAAGDPRVYDPVGNPGGVRCDIADYQQAIWGQRPRRLWTAPEKAAGHGFAPAPLDNVGIEYGLAALRAGVITPHQFADLNAHVGGNDVDANWQPARSVAGPGTLSTAYRTGQVTEGLRLDRVPIIDLRGSANANDIHTDYHSWELRARLDEATGSHANDVIWTWHSFGNFAGITPPPDIAVRALLTMDAWLAGIEADHRQLPLPAKVRAHRPAAAVDACWPDSTLTAGGTQVVDPEYAGACGQAFPHYGDARQVAGDRLAGTTLKCQLRPLRRSELPGLSDADWATLVAAFPGGICDWSRPGIGARPSLPWITFAAGPGGRPLPTPRR